MRNIVDLCGYVHFAIQSVSVSYMCCHQEEKIPDIKERIDMAVFPALQAPIHFCFIEVQFSGKTWNLKGRRQERYGKVRKDMENKSGVRGDPTKSW